jgi:hypothetical protein
VNAERDYAASVQILETLQQSAAIQGTDVTTLDNARAELARIRKEIAERTRFLPFSCGILPGS